MTIDTLTEEHLTTPSLSRTYEFRYRATDGELDFILDPTSAQVAQFDYGSKDITVSRTFDDDFRVKTETVNGSTVSFGYDNDGLPWTAGT